MQTLILNLLLRMWLGQLLSGGRKNDHNAGGYMYGISYDEQLLQP